MSTPKRLSSSSEEGLTSLNLLRGSESLLASLATMERSSMPWLSALARNGDDKEYLDLEEKILSHLEVKYADIYRGGLLPFYLSFQFKGETFAGAAFKKRGRRVNTEECHNAIFDALDSDGELVVLRISIRRKQEGQWRALSHACVLIFHKRSLKVEFYDPNGYRETLSEYPFWIRAISGFIETLKIPYTLEKIERNNLKYGFQSMEYSVSKKYYPNYIDRGLCAIWSLYVIDLRTKYFEDDGVEFKKRVQDRVNYLKKKRHPGFFFVNYILEYMLNALSAPSSAK